MKQLEFFYVRSIFDIEYLGHAANTGLCQRISVL